MITPETVKTQLLAVLPRNTTEFSTMLTGVVAVTTASTIACTKVAHGLATNDVISVSDAEIDLQVSLASYDAITDKVTLTVSSEHDRTSGLVDKGEYNKAVLSGFADSTFNGTFAILSATETTVTFTAPNKLAPVGALGVMTENRSLILGLAVVTVVDEDNFTIPLGDNDLASGVPFSTFSMATASRILIAADMQRAIDAFKARADREPSLFIIFEQESASKDRETLSDAVIAVTAQNDMQITYLQGITLVYMSSTKKDPLAGIVQEKVYGEVRPAIRKSMFGHRFEFSDSPLVFAAIETANAPVYYNAGNYLHTFVYQIPYKIDLEQGEVERPNVSLRHILMDSTMFNAEGALLALELEPEI